MTTIKGYKLFALKRTKPGQLFSLFIHAQEPVPLNTWLQAESFPTKGYAVRPGWHVGAKPRAPHLSSKGRVWAEVEIQADLNWQPVVDELRRKSLDFVPVRGYYRFERPRHQGSVWYIAANMKVNRVLAQEEVDAINAAG